MDSWSSQGKIQSILFWKNNGWKNSQNKPVENQDLIKKIDEYLVKYQGKINIQWVRAHTGENDENSLNNKKADELANKGATRYAELYLLNWDF